MNFSNLFSLFLLVCILQTLVSISILTFKKYRRIPNLFLLALFMLFLIYYLFSFFEYFGYFSPDHFRATAIMPFQILPPVLVYLYSYTRMHGNITGVRELFKHFVVFILGIVFFVPIIIDSFTLDNSSAFFKFYSHVYRIVFSFITIGMYLVYAKRTVILFAEYNNVSGDNFILKLFNLPGKVKIVKSTVVLLFTCGVWFLMELFLSIFLYDIHKYIDFLIASTLCLLSILLSYTFIKHPKKITVA